MVFVFSYIIAIGVAGVILLRPHGFLWICKPMKMYYLLPVLLSLVLLSFFFNMIPENQADRSFQMFHL